MYEVLVKSSLKGNYQLLLLLLLLLLTYYLQLKEGIKWLYMYKIKYLKA